MLRRKPTRIELRGEDREELEEAHRLRFATVTTPSSSASTPKPSDSNLSTLSPNPNPNPLYKLLDPSLDPVTKSQRIGIHSPSQH
ncbi:Anaphase-promoting complex APC subunit CDC26 [Carex littledalei]|uniref:Anaphase-promoting complex APC subunit CDC26 n=1 Tax=Carex littledalei TaxID=544730 RepID=A0A833QVE7_9POAL|nr:Anaphase-promoting complex APC subunit CDC26 [Carex littledalei]